MTPSARPGATPRPPAVVPTLVVLAIVGDDDSRAMVTRLLTGERVVAVRDLVSGLAHARADAPDVAFVDISLGDGAGLAMVHHIKAVAPEATVYALATPATLEIAANAVALGGAGLIMLPLAGDEVLNAVDAVRLRRAEVAARAQLEQSASEHERAAGWIARIAELSEAPDRAAAGRQLVEVVLEATGGLAAAVYLVVGEGSSELTRVAASSTLERGPGFGAEMDILDFARRERLSVVPLTVRQMHVGHVLLDLVSGDGTEAPPRIDGLLRLLATQATTSFALIAERDRAAGTALKDPKSSAYSFAYYVDVAGREIDRARRHGRRFAIATVAVEPNANDEPWAAAPRTPAEIADDLLKAVRDTDMVARVDEHEFHLLLPETDGLGAHACRRRVLARLAGGDRRGSVVPPGVLVGVATFPHDGRDLAQLLRMARRRAEASKASIVHRLAPEQAGIADVFEALEWDARVGSAEAGQVAAAQPIELPIADAASLATTVVAHAIRGGATFLAVAHHPALSLGAAVRAQVGPGRENVVLHALDIHALPQCADIEALAVIAEHGAYALLARNQGGVLRGVHAADPLLADLLAERLGRAAGLRVFN